MLLAQEVAALTTALAMAHTDLAALRAALAGAAALTPALDAAADALVDGRPPPGWAKRSWGAPSAAAWAAGAAARHTQLAKWLAGGRPRAVWLPGLFNPAGLLTAVRQEAARARSADGWALDDVVVKTEVGKCGVARGGTVENGNPGGRASRTPPPTQPWLLVSNHAARTRPGTRPPSQWEAGGRPRPQVLACLPRPPAPPTPPTPAPRLLSRLS